MTNLVPRVHVSFGQRRDTELWNILGVPDSGCMCALVYMTSRDKVDVDAFHKGIRSIRTGKTRKVEISALKEQQCQILKAKDMGSGNEIVDYSRASCLGTDQKTNGLWEQDTLGTRLAEIDAKIMRSRGVQCNTEKSSQ